jgi:hypothetical protein
VFFTPDGVLRGPEAIRGVFEKLFSEFAKPGVSIASKQRLIEGGYVYSVFTAETPDHSYEMIVTSPTKIGVRLLETGGRIPIGMVPFAFLSVSLGAGWKPSRPRHQARS